ncbi:MAG: glycosyltransferase, partial [Xanthomonadales bacterium]|nr:glycosyltransferase [Xanthomonadales bacterium]
PPRVADYRASAKDLAEHLLTLMNNPELRRRMGDAGRKRAVEVFDYRAVARRFVRVISERLGIE